MNSNEPILQTTNTARTSVKKNDTSGKNLLYGIIGLLILGGIITTIYFLTKKKPLSGCITNSDCSKTPSTPNCSPDGVCVASSIPTPSPTPTPTPSPTPSPTPPVPTPSATAIKYDGKPIMCLDDNAIYFIKNNTKFHLSREQYSQFVKDHSGYDLPKLVGTECEEYRAIPVTDQPNF
jgi:hypothetical protein